MSDTSPRNQAALRYDAAKPAPRQPRAGELLFEFVRPDHERFRCELRDDGPHGIDVQFFRNEEFMYSRRLETRGLAIQWAEQERLALAGGLHVD